MEVLSSDLHKNALAALLTLGAVRRCVTFQHVSEHNLEQDKLLDLKKEKLKKNKNNRTEFLCKKIYSALCWSE